MEIKYENINTKYFSHNDFNYLIELKKIININSSIKVIQSFLNKFSIISINSAVRSLELDLEGFFKIETSEFRKHFIKNKFDCLSKKEIFEQIILRIESIKEGEFKFPESIYEIKTIKIEYKDRLINVDEILIEPFAFMLYQNIEDLTEYFLEVVTGSLFIYTNLYNIKKEDIHIVKSLNSIKK